MSADPEAPSLLHSVYRLATSMITADGEIKEEEVDFAAAHGTTLFPEFDKAELNKHLKQADGQQHFEAAIRELSTTLSVQHKDVIYDYLQKIATSDDQLDDDEEKRLRYVRKQWGLEHLV
ncbi:tellurite resistance protein TerB [Mariprofundus micogutta]|uniref:Tellurite resistance protein TerB n=1 Tax=Mariprofundus micogutta TaxID=1921010 RepID=A0A1L8CNF6_9PROT|nr:TerB family tellurite resistance protein [Mariprofundus micogutta]GAV20446.1 tellurite resistance protein TerB [Mariprofundus micogutta]